MYHLCLKSYLDQMPFQGDSLGGLKNDNSRIIKSMASVLLQNVH